MNTTTKNTKNSAVFTPQLFFKVVLPALSYYQQAFDAKILRLIKNDDGSIHLHEETSNAHVFSPPHLK